MNRQQPHLDFTPLALMIQRLSLSAHMGTTIVCNATHARFKAAVKNITIHTYTTLVSLFASADQIVKYRLFNAFGMSLSRYQLLDITSSDMG